MKAVVQEIDRKEGRAARGRGNTGLALNPKYDSQTDNGQIVGMCTSMSMIIEIDFVIQ